MLDKFAYDEIYIAIGRWVCRWTIATGQQGQWAKSNIANGRWVSRRTKLCEEIATGLGILRLVNESVVGII